MKVFKDVFTGDELFSDSFPHDIVDDIVYKVEGKYITENDDFLSDDSSMDDQFIINIVNTHKLQRKKITKKQYQLWFKEYITKIRKHLKNKNPDRISNFHKQVIAYGKIILSNFKEYEFYVGKSSSDDSQIFLLHHGDDGMSPTFYFWYDGIVIEEI